MSGRRPEVGSHAEMVTRENAAVELYNSCQHGSIQHCTAPHYPAHFTKGSIIHLASGELKRIEDLSTEDFVRSAEMSSDLCIDTSVVCRITPVTARGTVMLEFCVGQDQVQVTCSDCIARVCVVLPTNGNGVVTNFL